MMAERGCVLGIDVGFSERRRTTGMAALWWDGEKVMWKCETATSCADDRTAVLDRITSEVQENVLAVGIDGPLLPHLVDKPTYRCAEALLTWGTFGKRGKPGAGNSGNGPRLHREAITLTHFTLEKRKIARATHVTKIHDRAVIEAFPNLFLGVLCNDNQYPERPRNRHWTDALFPVVHSCLTDLLTSLLPGREIPSVRAVCGHDAIAAFVCAVTALCIAAGRYVAVGAHADGFIMLPPHDAWGPDSWAERQLVKNVARHASAIVYRDATVWMDSTRTHS